MQINDITEKRLLTEVSFSDMINAVFSRDPNMAGMNLQQTAAAVRANKQIDQIADAAYQGWLIKHMNLMKVNRNQPLDPAKYKSEVKAHVLNQLLPRNVDFDELTVKTDLYRAIDDMANSVGDPAKNREAWNRIVDLSTVARQDPRFQRAYRSQYSAARGTAPTSATTPGSIRAAKPVVRQAIMALINRNQQSGLAQVLQSATIRSTGNPTVDAFLEEFGVRVR